MAEDEMVMQTDTYTMMMMMTMAIPTDKKTRHMIKRWQNSQHMEYNL
jgi:hypothetical protein